MKLLFASLIALAIASPAAAQTKKARANPRPKVEASAAVPILLSPEAARVAAWVAASKDNRALPYAIIDKVNAALFLFDASGEQLDAVPVLIGIASGDEATPGVGSKKLSDLGPAEKTTPAGRYLAKFGLPVAGERVLWVDYATSVALHPIPADASPKEKRRERMLSPTPTDNRITFGCINVPRAFYSAKLRPGFRRKGGYVYILPDTKPIDEVFPRLRTMPAMG
ncbi:hypothetical protein [Sphingomonas sp. Y38-1Y]|uniref:hypothetical protein n=1 Tax=Sphingomonas sp. Y38-1Y TaxID=3078265 RepID=UPI0028E3435B|nr:hypothetical protein [Sphingomonas sp. Y38-1Y]